MQIYQQIITLSQYKTQQSNKQTTHSIKETYTKPILNILLLTLNKILKQK